MDCSVECLNETDGELNESNIDDTKYVVKGCKNYRMRKKATSSIAFPKYFSWYKVGMNEFDTEDTQP